MICLTLPIRTVSESNMHEHWRKRHKRRAEQRAVVRMALQQHVKAVKLPVLVTLTRIAPGTLDRYENLPNSMKAIVDGVADAFGITDRSPLIEFRSGEQRRSKTYAVEIRIEEVPR